MFEAVGKRVIYLKRIQMGGLKLDEALKPGEFRELTHEEVLLLSYKEG
jgi:16S rRNA pseudouridine516 synthase